MGDTNVVSLLGRISMNLDKLVQMNTMQQAPQEQQKTLTNTLNSGTATVSQGTTDIKISGVSPSELTGMLASFPKQVLSIAVLRKSVMNNFKSVFTDFVKTVALFNNIKLDQKSADAAKIISESIVTLSAVNFRKLSKQLEAAGGNAFGKDFTSAMGYIVDGLRLFEKLDGEKIKPGVEAANASTVLISTLISSVNKIMISVIGLAVAIKFIGGEEIAKSTAIILGTLTALTGIAVGVAAVSKFVGENSMKDISKITGFIFKMQLLCVSTLLLGFVYKEAMPVVKDGFTGIAVTLLGYTALIALCGVVANLVPDGIKNMSTVALVAIAGIALTVGTMFMGEFAKASYDDILAGFAAVSGIIFGYSAIVTAAAAIAKKQPAVIKDFGAIALIAIGAMGVTYLTMLLGKAVRGESTADSKFAGEWMVAEGFVLVSGILYGYTGIIRAASKISPVNAGKALLSLGSVDLIALATILVVKKTADVAKSVNDAGAVNVLETLGIAALMITAFGGIAFAAGALVFGPQAALFAAGLAALGSIDLLVLGTSATLVKAVGAAEVIKNSKGEDGKYKFNELTDAFSAMVSGLGNMLGLKFIMDVAKISANAKQLITVNKVIAAVATSMSKVAMISGPNGTVRGVTVTDDGQFIYGEFVDIKAASTSISDAFKTFTTTLLETFKSISLGKIFKAGIGVKIIGGMIEPVSLFAKTMLSFQDAGKGKIKEIRFNQDGTLVDTPAVDVKKVSDIIAASISTFASTLFSEENQDTWKRITRGGINLNGEHIIYAEKAMGILATVISPVSEFANTLTQFESGDENTIVVPIYGENGVVTSRRTVNVTDVANAIARAVSKFANTLFNSSDIWAKLYKPKTVKTKDGGWFGKDEFETVNQMEGAIGVFANVITPVISFTNILSKYGAGSDDTLLVYGTNGESREIDVTDVALKISGAVTKFVNTLVNNISISNNDAAEALTNTSNSINSLFTNFDKFVGSAETNSVKKLSVSVDGVSKSFKDFDKVLADGTTKRVDSIKKLGDAFDTLKQKLANAKSDLNEVKEIFESLNKADTSNINNVVDKISEKLKFTIDHTGGVTTSDITRAIISAVDGGTLQEYTYGSGDSARHRYEIDLDGSFSN